MYVTFGPNSTYLHARHISIARTRAGPADHSWVQRVKDELVAEGLADVRVISNGNVRCYEDAIVNKEISGIDGVMVGEALLGNPRCVICESQVPKLMVDTRLFSPKAIASPVEISQEYLSLCRALPETVSTNVARQHVKHIFSWYLPLYACLA